MFGSLLERPLITADAHEKFPLLIRMYDRELDCCKLLFRKQTQMVEKMGELQHLTHSHLLYISEGSGKKEKK